MTALLKMNKRSRDVKIKVLYVPQLRVSCCPSFLSCSPSFFNSIARRRKPYSYQFAFATSLSVNAEWPLYDPFQLLVSQLAELWKGENQISDEGTSLLRVRYHLVAPVSQHGKGIMGCIRTTYM